MASLDQSTTALPRPARAHAILLIDDQRFVGMALARLLDGEPLELHCCERGAEAEATADRVRPALILQDLVMPDVDGLALVKAFRHRASTAHTPVIVLSGNDDEATRARALAAGAVDYLVKLPTRAVLMACLERHLPARAQGPAEPGATASDDASDVALDPEFLATYRDEGAADPDETLRELLDVFFRDAERLIGDLRRAAAAGFNAAVPRVAHALKGCALAAGARAMAGVCAQLETGTLSATDGVARLDVELARVKAAPLAGRPEGGQSNTVLARRSLQACSSEAEPR
jgi:DNA-binding response OmpR family regulator